MEETVEKNILKNNKIVAKQININDFYTWYVVNDIPELIKPSNGDYYLIVFGTYKELKGGN